MPIKVDHVSVGGLVTARSLESVFVGRENGLAPAVAKDGSVQRPASLPQERSVAPETTAKAQQDDAVLSDVPARTELDSGNGNSDAVPVFLNIKTATDAALDPKISPIGVLNDSFDSRYSSTGSTKGSRDLGAAPPPSTLSSAVLVGTNSARTVAKKSGGSDERRRRSKKKTSSGKRDVAISRGHVSVSEKALEAEHLSRRRLSHLTASSSRKSSILYGVEAGAEWQRPRLASVPPRPPVAPEWPFMVQSSVSSVSSDMVNSPTARPVSVAAAAAAVDNESWKKALKWRSQTPAPSIVSKLPGASTGAAAARSTLPHVRPSSSIRVAPETARASMSVTIHAGSTVPSEEDSASSSRRHEVETRTLLRRKNTLGMVEESQVELLPRSRTCASPETAPETPRVNPSLYEKVAEAEAGAAVVLTPAPPETSVPEGSALESPPTSASASSHNNPVAEVLVHGDETDDLVTGCLDDIPFESLASSAAAELEAAEITAKAAKVEAETAATEAATEAAAAAAAAAAAERSMVQLEETAAALGSTFSEPVSTPPKPSFSPPTASPGGSDAETRATGAGAYKIMTPLHRKSMSEPKIILPPRSSTRRRKARRSSSAVGPRVSGAVSLPSSRRSSKERRVRGVRARAHPASITPSTRSRRSRGSTTPEKGDSVAATLTAAAAAVAKAPPRFRAVEHREGGEEADVQPRDGAKAKSLEADAVAVVAPNRVNDETQRAIAGKGATDDAHRMPPSFEFMSEESSTSLRTPAPATKGFVPPSVLPSVAADPASPAALDEDTLATVAFGTVEIDVMRGTNAPSEDTCAGSHLSSITNDTGAFFGDTAAEHMIAAADARWWDTAAAGSEIGVEESSAIVSGPATEALSSAVEAAEVEVETEPSPALYGSVAWAREEERAARAEEIKRQSMATGSPVVEIERALPEKEEFAVERTAEGKREELEEEPHMQSQIQMEASSSEGLRGVSEGRGRGRGGVGGGKFGRGGGGMYTVQTPPPFHGESGGQQTAAGAVDDTFVFGSDDDFGEDSPVGFDPSQAQTVGVEEEDSPQQQEQQLEQIERDETDIAIDISAIEEADKEVDVSGVADDVVGHGDKTEAVVETQEPPLSLGSSAIAAVMEWGGMGTDGGIVKRGLATGQAAADGEGVDKDPCEEQKLSAVDAFGCQCVEGVHSVVEMLGSVEVCCFFPSSPYNSSSSGGGGNGSFVFCQQRQSPAPPGERMSRPDTG